MAAAAKEAAQLRERLNHSTNRMGQLEHKVGSAAALLLPGMARPGRASRDPAGDGGAAAAVCWLRGGCPARACRAS
jgi:hypothetical protein